MLRFLSWCGCIALGIVSLVLLFQGVVNHDVSDFATYYHATAISWQKSSGNPYGNIAPFPPYYYPPGSLILFGVLLLFGSFWAKILFSIASVGAVYAALFLFRSIVSPIHPLTRGMVLLLLGQALFLQPVWFTVTDGQINAVLFFLVTLGLWAVLTKRQNTAGLVLGVAAVLKLTPALLVWYALLKRQYRVVVVSAAVFLLLHLCAELLLPGINWQYWRYIVDDISKQGGASYRDQSVQAFLYKMGLHEVLKDRLSEGYVLTPFLHVKRLMTLGNYAIIGSGGLLLTLFTLRRKSSARADMMIEYSLFWIMAVVGSGLTWFHHYTLLLLPLWVATWMVLSVRSRMRPLSLAFLGLCYLAMAINLEFQFHSLHRNEGWGGSPMLYGAAGIALLLVLYFSRIPARSQ